MRDSTRSNVLSRAQLGPIAKIGFFLASGVVAGLAIGERCEWLNGQDSPVSTDGYFYLQEFRSHLATGGAYYRPSSPFFYTAGLIGRSLGLNEHTLFQVSIVAALTITSVALLLGIATRSSRLWLAPAMASLPWLSEVLFYRYYAFPRQFLSIAFVLYAWALLLCWERSSTRLGRSMAIGAAILLGTGASIHLIGSVLACVSLIVVVSRVRMSLLSKVALSSSFLAAGAVLIHQSGKKLIASGPVHFEFGWQHVCTYMGCSTVEISELLLYQVLAVLITAYVILLGLSRWYVMAVLAVHWLLNLPIWDTGSGAAFRFAVASLPLLLFTLSVTRFKRTAQPLHAWLCILTFVSLTIFHFFFDRKDYGQQRPAIRELASHAITLQRWIPNDAHVQAPHGYQFAATYYLGRSSAVSLQTDGVSTPDVFIFLFLNTAPKGCHDLRNGAPMKSDFCVKLTETPQSSAVFIRQNMMRRR